MSLNKEQVLALVVLGLGAWFYSGLEVSAAGGRQFMPPAIEHAIAPVAKAPLVETDVPAGGRADLFTQPRESCPHVCRVGLEHFR